MGQASSLRHGGQSGSGKSTLLIILGALDVPTAGTELINVTNKKELSATAARAVTVIFDRRLCEIPDSGGESVAA
jgi:ABC-type lipoprotein export system ATPase subunit